MVINKLKLSRIVLAAVVLVIVLIEATQTGDFDIFLQASRSLFNGENVYVVKYHDSMHYYYDVPFLILLFPLTKLPLYWANLFWLLLNLFFTYRIWQVFEFYMPLTKLSQKTKNYTIYATAIFLFALWHKNLHLTQMTIFILFLALESFRLFERDRALAGALLLGLGITIKILPIVFLPYLLYRAHFKEFLWVCFFCLALLLLPFLFLENEFYFTLLQSRWELINPSNKIHVVDLDERSFHSLTSFLAALLTDIRMDHHALETKRNLATLSVEQLEMVINVVRLCFVLLMLYFLRTFPFTRAKDKVQKFYELSYLCYVIPLIFPHQQHYAFFFVAPAIYYLAYFYFYSVGTAENPYPILKWLFWILTPIIFFTLSADFLLGEFREYYNHFKTLTYGVLLILPLLILAQPHKLKI